jgi:TadE-like protein
MIAVRNIVGNSQAASAAEFALVLPLFLLLVFGIIDAGRFMWEYNRAEKATQMGARFAVATDLIPSGLSTYSFSNSGGIPQGQPVPTTSFNYAVCTNSSCGTCVGSACGVIGYDGTAFTNVVRRMALMYPPIGPTNVQVEYRNVGLGYAGDPNGPDVAPLVTVRLQGLTFQPITCMVFACSVTMPDFRASLTLEDGTGTYSN